MPQKKKSKLPVNPSNQDQLHYNAVLLEEIRSQMNGVIETVQLTGQRLDEKIDSSVAELKQDIHLTQTALTKRVDDVEKRLTERMDRIETKLDKVVEKVDHHDEDIDRLKTVVFPAT